MEKKQKNKKPTQGKKKPTSLTGFIFKRWLLKPARGIGMAGVAPVQEDEW